jgi:serine/threonine protein kinase
MVLEKVQLTDLDKTAYLPNGKYIRGMIVGNENWQSPEAFFKSKISKPSGMYSFGIVVNASTHILILAWPLILLVYLCCFRSCEPYIPYKPFVEWLEVGDIVFKDLIPRLMKLDSSKRITAQHTLEHSCFKNVE